jgi:hypothetical protein
MKLFTLLWHFFRELSDEAAYARHLKNTCRPHSPAEWREFSNGRYRRKYQNAKCC